MKPTLVILLSLNITYTFPYLGQTPNPRPKLNPTAQSQLDPDMGKESMQQELAKFQRDPMPLGKPASYFVEAGRKTATETPVWTRKR